MESRLERQLHLVELAQARGSFRFGRALDELHPLSTATLTRLLKELVATGMLERREDGSYGPGQRPLAWSRVSDQGDIPDADRMQLSSLRDELACTVTFWTVHARAQRCRFRASDEYSPAFAPAGVVRPLIITVGGAGLSMERASLEDIDGLMLQARRAPLKPSERSVRQLAQGCLRNRIYDDRGAFFPGCRRIAVPVGRHGLIACAMAATRFRLHAERSALVASMQACADSLSFSKV
jgi:DNA-binding IclR family transcriptional regulator